MNSLHALVLSIVCIVGGVVLAIVGKDPTMASMLAGAGIVGTTASNVAVKRQAAASDRKARAASDELERTQNFLRESGIHRRD